MSAPPPKPNPTCTITNNLGYDVDIYDVYDPNAAVKGPLTYTKLVTVPNGASAQTVQTTRLVSQLQAMRTGSITALNNDYYKQFPVAVMPVTPFTKPPAFTLTSDMQQAMELTFNFIKYTTANPTSQMATDFRTALGNTDQKTAVNSFFKNTASFKQCTYTTWNAVFSWQGQFTSPWQGTFYLYSLGSSQTAPALVATLAIVSSTDTNSAVLTMAGTNNQNILVVMGGDGTMQEQNQGTGPLSVALNPTWMNITQTSQTNPKDVTYVIAAAYTGTINGTKVAGNLNQLAIPDPSDSSQPATDQNSANAFSLDSISNLAGLLISVGMLYFMYKGHQQSKTQKENDAQRDATNAKDAASKVADVDRNFVAKDVPQMREAAAPVNANVAQNLPDAEVRVGDGARIQNELGVVRNQEAQLGDEMQVNPPGDVTENVAQELVNADTSLENAMKPGTSSADIDANVGIATTNLNNANTEIKTQSQEQRDQLSREEKQAQDTAAEAIEDDKAVNDATDAARQRQEDRGKNDETAPKDPNEFKDPEKVDPPRFEPRV